MTTIKREERIGGQTLILGDCLEVMGELGRFDAVVTDPPYEDELHNAVGKFQRLRKDGKEYRSNKVTSFGFDGIGAIRGRAADAVCRASDGWVIVFCLAEGVRAWRDEIQAYAKYDTCLAWVKPDCAPRFNGQGAARGFECAVTAWAGRGHRKWNGGGKRGVYVHSVNPPDRHGGHQTEKPWRLFVDLLQDFTCDGQTILDPFMGSGTTLVACQKLGRKGTGIEIDPDYFEVACKRVEEATRQPDLFIEQPDKPTQTGMDL